MTETKAITPIVDLRKSLDQLKPELKMILPEHVTPEKFVRVILNAVQQTPALLEADRPSLFSACMKAAQDGLLVDGREAAIVVYKDKSGAKIAQYQPMRAGIMKKVRNSGEISTWSVQVVKKNDKFKMRFGDDEKIEHEPALNDRGETIGAYSIVTLRSGEKTREWMNIQELEDIRKRSRAGQFGPWVTDTDEMYKKTVLKRHAKNLPMSSDLDGVLHADDEIEGVPVPQPVVTPEPAAEKPKSRIEKIIQSQAPAPAVREPGDDEVPI